MQDVQKQKLKVVEDPAGGFKGLNETLLPIT